MMLMFPSRCIIIKPLSTVCSIMGCCYYCYHFFVLVAVVIDAVAAVDADGTLSSSSSSPPQQNKSLKFDVVHLTTEYLVEPLGVDKSIPRVSWQIQINHDNNKNRVDIPSDENGGGDDHNNDDADDANRVDPPHHDDDSPRRGIYQKSFELQISTSPAFIDVPAFDCIGGTKQQHLVPLICDGLMLQSDTNYWWRVIVTIVDSENNILGAASAISKFRTGLLLLDNEGNESEENPWNGAKWITGGNTNRLFRSPEFQIPSSSFSHDANSQQDYATLFISGIGYYEAYINGQKVGNHVLDPGWTDYEKHVWYSTFDVTDLLSADTNNVIAVMLGNGWWSCGDRPGTNMPNCKKKDPPQLIVQLRLNGQPILFSGSDVIKWKVGPSPVVYDSLYNGEIFDNRIATQVKGWNEVGFNDSGWSYARLTNSTVVNGTSKLRSQLFEPIKHISRRQPISIKEYHPKKVQNQAMTPSLEPSYVLDFGQNQAAIVELKNLTCRRGSNVTIRHAEVLQHPPYGPRDGSIYTENLRSAQATDTYICSGDPNGEFYRPTFTQHGFRYIQIDGLQEHPRVDDIAAIELHTDIEPTSSIHFSNSLLNEIQHLVVWSLKSNVMSVPTDCNNRDERRGWMGDAALSNEAFAFNYGMGAFFSKWLDQLKDAQFGDGSFPNYVPGLGSSKGGAPNWQSAYVDVMLVMLTHYEDVDLLIEHHDAIVKYFDYLELNYNQTGIRDFMTGYGDWVPPKPHPKSDGHLVGAFALIHDIQVGIKLFRSSVHHDAPRQLGRLTKLETFLHQEFHNVFYNVTTGIYMSGLQTEQALPLYLGTASNKDIQQSILSHLVKDILETNHCHTTCGIIGIKYLMEALSRLGHSDVALKLALQTTYPSWGYMIQNDENEPATTLWELWSSSTDGPNMNSRNHHMFAAISSWFYKYVAGITTDRVNFNSNRVVTIRPLYSVMTNPNLTYTNATIRTPYGNISSSWKVTNFHCDTSRPILQQDICVPLGMNGFLHIPILKKADDGNSFIAVSESGIAVWSNHQFIQGSAVGIRNATYSLHKRSIIFEISNGCFHFNTAATVRPKPIAFSAAKKI